MNLFLANTIKKLLLKDLFATPPKNVRWHVRKALSVSFPSSYLGIVFLMIFSTLLLPFDKWFLANALSFMHAWLGNLTTIWFSDFLHIIYNYIDIWLWLIIFFVLQKWTYFVLARSFQHCSSTVKGLNGNFQTLLSRDNKKYLSIYNFAKSEPKIWNPKTNTGIFGQFRFSKWRLLLT